MKKFFIYFTTSLLFFSCISNVNEKQDNGLEIKVDLKAVTEPSIYDFFDTVSVVQLETSDDCLVSNRFDMKEFNGKYFLMDMQQIAVFCFDSEGKYLFKIQKRGQGPDEYMWLGGFTVDPFNNQLILLDPWGAILLYDMDGKFISKTRLPSEIGAYNDVYVLNRDTLVFSCLAEYQIVYYSKKENRLVKKMYENDEALHKTSFMSAFGRVYSYNDSIYLPVPWSNETINLSDNENPVSYRWDLGKETFSEKDMDRQRRYLLSSDKRDYDWEDLIGPGKLLSYYIFNIHETERYITAGVCYENDYMSIFYDKSLKKSFVFKKTKENTQLIMATTNISGEKMIMAPAWEPNNYLPFYDENTLSPEDRKKLQERKEDDNPYLIVYKFKPALE